MIKDFKSVIDLWPSLAALAEDIVVEIEAVRKWRQRGSIPAEYWVPMVEAAKGREISGVSYERLAYLAASKVAAE